MEQERNYEDEYRKLTEYERELPSGFKVKFRRLGVGEWIGIWISVPRLIEAIVSEPKSQSDISSEVWHDNVNKMMRSVCAASVCPRFYMGPPTGAGQPGEMSVELLSDSDLAYYLQCIAESLGFGGKVAKDAADVLSS